MRSSPDKSDAVVLAGLLVLSAAVAAVSAAATISNVEVWYAALVKPPFNPPNWLFGPVWTALYLAMAIAAWRVWRCRGRAGGGLDGVGLAGGLYAAQMALNFAWSLIFFGMHRIGAAMVDIVGLLALLAATTVVFWKRDALAGLLMAPYLAWVSFAAILNFAIWRLN